MLLYCSQGKQRIEGTKLKQKEIKTLLHCRWYLQSHVIFLQETGKSNHLILFVAYYFLG